MKISRSVPGFGQNNPRIMIIGEAPGEVEESKGMPFVGPSGRILNTLLRDVGISRDECYITNVSKTRPPFNNFRSAFYSKTKPSQDLYALWTTLQQEIARVNPNLILCLGGEALSAVRQQTSNITIWRGHILTQDNRKVIGTFHPAYLMRKTRKDSTEQRLTWGYEIAKLDFAKASKNCITPDLPSLNWDIKINPSFDDVIKHLTHLENSTKTISFDIETISNRTRCIALSDGPRSSICIPFICKSPSEGFGPRWTLDEEFHILTLLKARLEDPHIPKVAQNFSFDATVLAKEFSINVKGLLLDTMVGFHLCYPELPKALDFLHSIYTDVPRYSDYNSSDDYSTWVYNSKDACVTHEISTAVEKELHEYGMWDFYQNHIEPLLYACCRAQSRPIHVDPNIRSELREQTDKNLNKLQKQIDSQVGHELNPSSPKQMQEFLYKELALPTRTHNKTGKPTTDSESLIWLGKKYPRHKNILTKILNYRQERKLMGTFLKPTSTNALMTSYNISGTVNGRLSSSAGALAQFNIQQIPKSSLRRMVIPPKGYTFIKSDLSQAESRVVAWLANAPELIKRFSSDPNFDIHVFNASLIFQVDEADVTEAQRTISKAGVHGGNYGLGPRKAASMYGIPFVDAKKAIEGYRSSFPTIQTWWVSIQQTLRETRTLESPLGRKRIFFGNFDDEMFRSGYSFIPQATVVDVINRAFAFGELVLQHRGFPLIQVHDEIVWCIKPQYLTESAKLIRNLMEYPIHVPPIETPLIIPVDMSVGDNWYDTSPLDKG